MAGAEWTNQGPVIAIMGLRSNIEQNVDVSETGASPEITSDRIMLQVWNAVEREHNNFTSPAKVGTA